MAWGLTGIPLFLALRSTHSAIGFGIGHRAGGVELGILILELDPAVVSCTLINGSVMSLVKILVVEDDILIAEEIAVTLKKAGYEVTASTDTCAATLEAVRVNPPDLIFMDIRIDGEEDGIETAKKLKDQGNFPIIFLTNLHDSETLKRAMAVKPANYLAKPFTAHQLLVSIQHALLNFSENRTATIETKFTATPDIITLPDTVFIKDNLGNFKKQEIADILYIEADRAYCSIHTQQERYVQSASMSHIKERINHPHLVQVSRSHVVNINKIDALKSNLIVIQDIEIKIGGQFRERFLAHLKLVR